ncbi:MAG: hypothetical protein ABI591_25485 [Kofleriaceae bacterium]|jgi:hypothetical protein
MSYAIAIILALVIIAVAIDMVRRMPPRERRPDDQQATTQKIIVDLDRR